MTWRTLEAFFYPVWEVTVRLLDVIPIQGFQGKDVQRQLQILPPLTFK